MGVQSLCVALRASEAMWVPSLILEIGPTGYVAGICAWYRLPVLTTPVAVDVCSQCMASDIRRWIEAVAMDISLAF